MCVSLNIPAVEDLVLSSTVFRPSEDKEARSVFFNQDLTKQLDELAYQKIPESCEKAGTRRISGYEGKHQTYFWGASLAWL